MTFGEKLRESRVKKGMTQSELAKAANLGLNTISNYESGKTYPKKREVYDILAEILEVDVNYLRNENEEFITEASEKYGYRGKQQADQLVQEIGGLFAGGELSEEDQAAFIKEMEALFLDAKEDAKKFTPKKYL